MPEEYDEIEIDVLDDGTVKFTTDKISGPNHQDAESFLAMITRGCNGPSRRIKIGNKPQKQKQKLRN
jgi:hypothetical protein